MPADSPELTHAEFLVLEAIWDGEHHIRPIAKRIYSENSGVQNATVQKLLDRLRQKGLVQRNRTYFPHEYSAKVSRGDLLAHPLKQVARQLCSRYHCVFELGRKHAITKDEPESLREFLDSLD